MKSRDKVFDAILKHWQKYAVPPTVQWLADECGLASTNTVSYHIDALVGDGRLFKINRHPVPLEIADAIRAMK